MIEIFSLKKTYYYAIPGILLTIIALLIGLDDNPLAITLIFISSIFIVTSFTYRLKKSKSYRILIFSSIGAFIVFSILHNVFEAIGEDSILKPIGIYFFFFAILLCPAAIIVGIIGFSVRQKQEEKK